MPRLENPPPARSLVRNASGRRGSARQTLLASLALVTLTSVLAWPGLAAAEATVSVTLKDPSGHPADGTVTLSTAEAKPVASCTTEAGKCEMTSVPGGMYTVTVQPVSGKPPKPRKVMIPPAGKVTLAVASG